MEDMFSKFLELMNEFAICKVDYVLIGGMAINLHGLARYTEDIDIFIKPTEENVGNLRTALLRIFNDVEINEITIEELNKYAVIRFGTEDNFYIDLITRIGEKFSFEDLVYEEKVIEGTTVRVADVHTLYRLKENTYREIDQFDIKFLKSKMSE